MVKVQPLSCTNCFHRGKSETEAAAAAGGTAAASLCSAELGRAGQDSSGSPQGVLLCPALLGG